MKLFYFTTIALITNFHSACKSRDDASILTESTQVSPPKGVVEIKGKGGVVITVDFSQNPFPSSIKDGYVGNLEFNLKVDCGKFGPSRSKVVSTEILSPSSKQLMHETMSTSFESISQPLLISPYLASGRYKMSLKVTPQCYSKEEDVETFDPIAWTFDLDNPRQEITPPQLIELDIDKPLFTIKYEEGRQYLVKNSLEFPLILKFKSAPQIKDLFLKQVTNGKTGSEQWSNMKERCVTKYAGFPICYFRISLPSNSYELDEVSIELSDIKVVNEAFNETLISGIYPNKKRIISKNEMQNAITNNQVNSFKYLELLINSYAR